MKTRLLLVAGFALTTVLRAEEPAKLEVHEWGTFTVVSGSGGVPLRWYQPRETETELPGFVQHNLRVAGKTGTSRDVRPGQQDFVRMETPVLYFYPERPMVVTAKVSFQQGRLTEWFPAPTLQSRQGQFTSGAGSATMIWEGELVAPDNAEAATKIPRLLADSGAHYGHAREVPGAWYFHDISAKVPPTSKTSVEVPSWEKFIFYRGAGDALPPLRAAMPEDHTLTLERHDEAHASPVVAFALQIEGDEARWARMTDLAPANLTQGKTWEKTPVQLNGPSEPRAQMEAELAAAMTKELNAAGLSQDEAKAMVATWRDSWLRDAGTRIFAIVPQAWVDGVLPLRITPEPQKVTRVFVARFELFSPSKEKAMLALAKPVGKVDAVVMGKIGNLGLGRFTNAALQRTKDLLEQSATPLQPATASR